jgi:hypothetical protein
MAKIYVPQLLFPRYISLKDPVDLGFKMYGEFHVTKKTRGVVTQELKFRNIITDIGLKKIAAITGGAIYNFLKYCQLGTGSTTPTSSDTALAAYANYKAYSNCTFALGSTNDRYLKMQWNYAAGDVVGPWTELALAWSYATSDNIFCRMLFKDDDGNPTSVTTTSDDTLTIVYYLHVIRSSDTPTENTITIDGTETVMQSLVTNKCLQYIVNSIGYPLHSADAAYQYLGTGTADLATTQTTAITPITTVPSTYAVKSYVSGTYYRELYSEWPSSVVGTFTNGLINIGKNMPIVFKFGTALEKTDDTKKIRVDLRVTYSRNEAA